MNGLISLLYEEKVWNLLISLSRDTCKKRIVFFYGNSTKHYQGAFSFATNEKDWFYLKKKVIFDTEHQNLGRI